MTSVAIDRSQTFQYQCDALLAGEPFFLVAPGTTIKSVVLTHVHGYLSIGAAGAMYVQLHNANPPLVGRIPYMEMYVPAAGGAFSWAPPAGGWELGLPNLPEDLGLWLSTTAQTYTPPIPAGDVMAFYAQGQVYCER